MNRLNRFSDCIAKFCKETGKPGPCADPNSKRQQRLKGLGAKAKAVPAAKAKVAPKAPKATASADAGKKAGSALAALGNSFASGVSRRKTASGEWEQVYSSPTNADEIAAKVNQITAGLSASQLDEAASGMGGFKTSHLKSKKAKQEFIVKNLQRRLGSLQRAHLDRRPVTSPPAS